MSRHLDWDGCWNARDLGGLPTRCGSPTRWGAVVRSESLGRLTPAGWAALCEHGVRTVVDLRNTEQAAAEPQSPPAGVATVAVPLEQGLLADPEFARWSEDGWLCTPLYYERFVTRWPERCAEAVAAVAGAGPGGVLVHCGMGRDRTGLVALLLLALVGARPDDIEADHGMTAERLEGPAARRLGRESDAEVVRHALRRASRSRRDAVLDLLRSVDIEQCLRAGGLTDEHLRALRERLVGPV